MILNKGYLLCGVAVLALTGAAHAQSTGAASTTPPSAKPAPGAPIATAPQEIEVVGSRIRGAKTTEALPVTVVSANQIAATGAVTGDDLLRSVPQMGTVQFNPSNGQQTSNSARGDIASIDLRGAGIGNTLVLMNGRRVVSWPTSQSKGNVPLIAYNAQTLPVYGMERLEVLRGGAGAIYGSDAVAGVVNVVTKTHYDGATISSQYGYAEGTHRKEYNNDLFIGHNFDDGRGNVSLSASFYNRTAQRPSDEPYTATQDLRSFFANDPNYNTSNVPDGRGNQSSYPALVAKSATGGTLTTAVKQGTVALTTAAGSFHVQPSTLAGCVSQIGNGLCIGTGTVPYTTTANVLRYDAAANDAITIAPAIDRQTGAFNAHYDLTNHLTAYVEADYYHSISHGLTTQPTALTPTSIPASNYYNPFGPVTFANGQTNPNRLPGLTNVPATGLPVTFTTYRFNDYGPDHVDVDSYQDRFIAGLKGKAWGFDWDSAILYGQAQVEDNSDGIDSTLLAKQLALSTPDAYNPFNGGCLDGSGGRDCTPSSQAALDATRIRLKRTSKSALTSIDFKVTRPDLFALPAGTVGVAMGVEARRETHSDIRDPRTNGTITFTDPVTGAVSLSDAAGVNVTPSTSGSRDVYSAFAEFAVPVISPEMNIPLVREVNVQLAGRYEHYSDFGDVAKPKVAVAWDVIKGVRLRATWEQGFKAPNLETTAPFTYARAQTVTDYYRCQAALQKGTITSFSACTYTAAVTYNESGNPSLQPETSESYDLGIVLQPTFTPASWGNFTITLDKWQLKQKGIVGVVGFANIAVEDYLSRLKGGAGSPNLIRSAPTVDDVAFYAGSGLAAVGTPTTVNDAFKNLQPQTIAGYDASLAWRKTTRAFGTFDGNIDATYLERFYQSPAPEVQALFDARAAGTINAATPLTGSGSQIEALANPRWKAIASLTWRLAQVQVGGALNYTGQTRDINFLSPAGTPYPVKSYTTVNLYGQYTFVLRGPVQDVKAKVGVRNLFDKAPPLESDGYNGALYQPYGRYVYFNLSASF